MNRWTKPRILTPPVNQQQGYERQKKTKQKSVAMGRDCTSLKAQKPVPRLKIPGDYSPQNLQTR
jgi:hypothetical protein